MVWFPGHATTTWKRKSPKYFKMMKIELCKLRIQERAERHLPLFYHFIFYNELVSGDPFTQTEFSNDTQSLVFFQRPEKLISKVIDMNILEKENPV